MAELKIEKGSFFLDGKEIFLTSAEVHYFRTPRENWEKVLNSVKEAGCNAVSFYTPWLVHEPEEGRFDFTGLYHPCNDLVAFLELVKKSGLLCYWRPGPYIYAEATDQGIPKWFTKKNPQSMVMRYEDGEYIPSSAVNAVAHMNGDFLAAVEKWYAAVSEVIKPYQAPDGFVVMTQLCNEIPGDDFSDENPVNLGLEKKDGIWPTYLREKYGTLEKINNVYGCSFGDFSRIPPYMLEQANKTLYEIERREYYYGCYYPKYFQKLRDILEGCGITTPMTHNAYCPRALSLHIKNKELNPWLNIGVDCYYSMSGNLNLTSGTYFCEYGPEYLKSILFSTPWVIEQESGYWFDFPRVYAPELFIWNVWAAAGGYKGLNMYLWGSGSNRQGLGFYGTDHNWQAPVDQNGTKRPSFDAIRRSFAEIEKHAEDFRADSVYDIALGVKREPVVSLKPVGPATTEVFYALRSQGFLPKLVDFENETLEELLKHPVLVVVNDRWMAREVQEKLASYVEAGGNLLLMGSLPTKDETDHYCHVLADELGVLGGTFPKKSVDQEKVLYEGQEYYLGKTIQNIDIDKKGETLGRTEPGRPAIVSVRKGTGTAKIFPVMFANHFKSQAVLIKKLIARLGKAPTVEGQDLLRVIPKANGKAFVLNIHPVPVAEKISIGSSDLECELEPYSYVLVDWKN